MQNNLRILSTKKLQINQRDLLLHAGFRLIEADFITVSPKSTDLSSVKEALIFTSSNAVKSVMQSGEGKKLTGKPCFCVGKKTRLLLERYGFEVVLQKDYATQLAEELTTVHRHRSFTFFCGNLRKNDLPEALTESGIDFNEVEVYTTELTPSKIDTPLQGILFFSPSGVRSFLKSNTISDAVCFCIGTTTAKPLEGLTRNIVIAYNTEIESVIVAVAKHFKKI
ncbi:uroporphyrinogen-III synthase [Sinomicrobium oceani]|uniref:uroporphyrinogen-III synthase n=1 Tax=Sinomicrobium oceani TaxID=1150368 RepID=UPI00227D4EF2|nr:uroporphyrinogen-III synthase [Sinomicrobium oceani]